MNTEYAYQWEKQENVFTLSLVKNTRYRRNRTKTFLSKLATSKRRQDQNKQKETRINKETYKKTRKPN